MSTHRNFDLICVVVLVLTLLLTILFMNGSRFGLEAIVDEDAGASNASDRFTANELNADWSRASATEIYLNGTEARVVGGGAYAYEDSVMITSAGYYVLSGSLADGSVIIDADKDSKIWLALDGVEIACEKDACLRIEQAQKVFLTLSENTVNTLSSGAEFSEDAISLGRDGAVFARDDLAINGSGELRIKAAGNHGLVAKDKLAITGGTVTVDAAADAIQVNDSFHITKAKLSLTAGDDGVNIRKDGGLFYCDSGELSVSSGDDALHSAGDVLIEGGDIQLISGDDAIHAETSFTITDGTLRIPQCREGIEAVTITIAGGDVAIYPEDDGLNASGGEQNIPTIVGFHAFPDMGMGIPPEDMAEFGGTEEEQPVPEFEQSNVSTDGIRQFPSILISGGSITVINDSARDADGLDSNGDIRITGGRVLVSLAGDGTNNAIDFGSESGGVCEISGGSVIACGSNTMAEGFDSSSTQCSFLYKLSREAETGSDLLLTDIGGKELLRWEVPCSFSSVIMSCPEMTAGESVLLTIGGETEQLDLEDVTMLFGTGEGASGTVGFGGGRGRTEGSGQREPQGGGGPDLPAPPGIPAGEERPGRQMESPAEAPAPEVVTVAPSQATGVAVTEISWKTWLTVSLAGLALIIGILIAYRYQEQ